MLTESESRSEATKGRNTWEKNGTYLPYTDCKRNITTMKMYIAHDFLLRANLYLQTAFSISWMHWVHCLGDPNWDAIEMHLEQNILMVI